MSLALLQLYCHGVWALWQALPFDLEYLRTLLVATHLGLQQCPRANCGPF